MPASVINSFTNPSAGDANNRDISTSNIRIGDRLLLLISHDDVETVDAITYGAGTGGDDAGFGTQVIGGTSGSHGLKVYQKFAGPRDEGAQTYNIQISNPEQMVPAIVQIRGDDGLDGTPVITPYTADINPDSLSMDTTEDNALVFRVLSVATNGATVTKPTGTDEVFNVVTSGGGGCRLACATVVQGTAGATGTAEWTISAANDSVALTISIKEGELQRDYAPAASGARKVFIPLASGVLVGGSDLEGQPAPVTEGVLIDNVSEFLDANGANAGNVGSVRFSWDVNGTEPLPAQVLLSLNNDPALSKAELWTREPTIKNAGGNGVYLWWIPGSGKTQPAANAQHGAGSVFPYSWKMSLNMGNKSGSTFPDSTLNGNDGSDEATGAATVTEAPWGVGSAEFDGSSDYIQVLDDATLDFQQEPLTILYMLQNLNHSGTGFRGHISKRNGTNGNYGVIINPDTDVSNQFFYDGGFEINSLSGMKALMPQDSWKCMAATYSVSGADVTQTQYIDGSQESQTTHVSKTLTANGFTLTIGATDGVSSFVEFWNGRQKMTSIIAGAWTSNQVATYTKAYVNPATYWDAQHAPTAGDGDGEGTAGGDISVVLAVTESGDTFASTGSPQVDGVLSVSESGDTFASTGSPEVDGSLSVTETGDTFASTGSPQVDGSLSVTETGDTFAAVGGSGIGAILAVTETGDTFSATLEPLADIDGALSVEESGDTFEASLSSLTASRIRGLVKSMDRLIV